MQRRSIMMGVLLTLVLSCVLAAPADAKLKKVGQSSFKWLSNPVSARGAGLGNAYMAIVSDASAVFWNPAGLANIERASVFFDYTQHIAEISYFAGAAAFNFGDYGVFGLNVTMMDYGDMHGTRLDPTFTTEFIELGTFSPTAYAFGLSYSRTMTDRFAFGGTIRMARMDFGTQWSTVSNTDGDVLSEDEIKHAKNIPVFDVGVMYYTHVKGIRFGAAFRNFSQETEFIDDEFSLPLALTFGGAADMIDLLMLHGLGANHAATFSSDFMHSRDYSSRIHYGAEYWYRGALALRGGYKFNYDEENFTFGAGLRGTLEDYTVQFDYAYNNFGVFDPVHKFSIAMDF